MARGKQKGIVSLKDTVEDSEIVRLGEIKNSPDYPLPDGLYGIGGKYDDYGLMKQRIAYRTGTEEEDGENKGKVIEYTVWEDASCYTSELTDMFKAYAKRLNLSEFKTKKMLGEISELIEIQQNTYDMIDKALAGFGSTLTQDQEGLLNLIDKKMSLEEEIRQLKKSVTRYKDLDKEIDSMYNTIKDKTAIIVNRDKAKTHRTPKEKE